MLAKFSSKLGIPRTTLGLLALLTILIVACGSAAQPTEAPNIPTFAPQQIPAATAAPAAPTAAPTPTAMPAQATSTRDTAVVVTEAEPASVGAWSEGCSGEIHSMGCQEFVTDNLTWLDDRTSEIVPLSGVESWEQVAPDKWRFQLRDGVKFHNGAPWNATAAKLGIDYNGTAGLPSAAIAWTGPDVTGEVIDELTLGVNCPRACPIFPRTALFTDFQDPEWFENADETERSRLTVGFGPYRIVDYQPGIHTKFEAYEDYLPNENFYSQAPSIQFITHVYRAENTVRAAMVQTGEADWAADIGFDEISRAPKAKTGKTAEVYLLVFDTVWHPELSKQKVRQALSHAVDCKSLLDALFDARIPCHAAVSMKGTVGITEENSRPREFNQDLARQLLEEAGYDPANSIDINSRPGSNVRGLEILESINTYWHDVGVTSTLNSWGDLGKARELQQAGCGRYSQEPGYKEAMDCAQRGPTDPYPASSHAYEIATSNEILDMQRFNQSRLSCFNLSSRVCIPELERQTQAANEIPEGPERTQAMIEIADYAYDQAFFLPLFEVVYVYGLAEDLEWEPYYAPRLRANTMSFIK
jgi:peptide/nickel transport system substrate-binding protein